MSATTEAPKRRALGKGLETLLPRVQAAAPQAEEKATESGKPREVPLDRIERNPYQTRTTFDEALLAELAASIVATGVVQPILVRPLGGDRYQLIAGERRWLASKKAGKTHIPAVVRQVSDEQAMEMTIVENLQRTDLNPMEQARAFERLAREFNMTQEQMARRTGKDRASIGNYLRLMRLPADVQQKLETGDLSFGHAKCLLGIDDAEKLRATAQKVVALSLSVRQTETMVQGILNPERKPKKEEKEKEQVDPNVRAAQEELQRALGLRVSIEDKAGRGRVVIEYSRLEDFDALLERLTR